MIPAHSVRGTGEPPLVLVHGYTGSQADWDPVVGPLAARRRVVTFDHRGHGESDRSPAEEYTFDNLVGDLDELVAALDLGGFDLLGHSLGGVVALRYALAHPGRLRSLILMDTACRPTNPMPMDLIGQMAESGRSAGMEAVAVQAATMLGRPETADLARRKLGRMDPEALVPFGQELDAYPSLCDRLGELDLPFTMIVGENDAGLRAAAELLAAGVRGGRLEVIPDAGHSPQEDQPELWLAAVEGHLSRLPPGPR